MQDAAAEVETLIEKADTGEADNPSAARKMVRYKMEELDKRFESFTADVKKMTYTNFKTKYIEHL